MNHPYKTREGGATVTIFVPYDCKNHCPFCINKEEYGDMTGFSLEKIVQSIRRMDAITPKCDFVFTGGSQFFICHNRTNTAHLDGVHTCFGRVVEGLEVIDQIRPGDLITGIDIIEEA